MHDDSGTILCITPFFSPNIGGVETFLDDMIDFIQNEKKYPIDVLTYNPLTNNKTCPVITRNGWSKIIRIPWPRFNLFYKLEKYPFLQLTYLGSGLAIAAFFLLLFNRKKYTIINVHGLASAFVGYVLKFFFPKRRYIATIHTNYRFIPGSILARGVSRILSSYDQVLALSQKCVENLESIGIPSEKLVRYHNWTNEQEYTIQDKSPIREKLGFDPKAFYALFVGRFSPEKGIFDLVENVPSIHPEIQVIIIGGGTQEGQVREKCAPYKNVRLLGQRPSHELLDYFNMSDILLYGSIDEDYLGRVSIQSLLCGLPIMIPTVSRYSGVDTPVCLELPDQVGVKFDSKKQNGLAEALNAIYKKWKNESCFDRDQCREFAFKEYSKTTNANIYLNTLLGQKGSIT